VKEFVKLVSHIGNKMLGNAENLISYCIWSWKFVQLEFKEGETESILLEGDSWNDDVITELQGRICESGSNSRGEEDQQVDVKPELYEKPIGMILLHPLCQDSFSWVASFMHENTFSLCSLWFYVGNFHFMSKLQLSLECSEHEFWCCWLILITERQSVMYKLHRKMIHGVSGGRIAVRFDTGFGEEKCESYYCVLTSSSATDKLHVTEHSIPFFLPLRELEKAHLATSPRVFIDYVGDILQAYVSRREQVREVKETKGEHIGELYHSLSFSLIELMLKEPHCQVCVIGNLFSHILYTEYVMPAIMHNLGEATQCSWALSYPV
jgi:hypothetical protein